MLAGKNAKLYRTISNVSVDELSKYMEISLINSIEDDTIIDNDAQLVRDYYKLINIIKQSRVIKTIDDSQQEESDIVNQISTENVVDEVKPKTRKTRQPKTKS